MIQLYDAPTFVTCGGRRKNGRIHVSRQHTNHSPANYIPGALLACGNFLSYDTGTLLLDSPDYEDRDWCDRCLERSWAARAFAAADQGVSA